MRSERDEATDFAMESMATEDEEQDMNSKERPHLRKLVAELLKADASKSNRQIAAQAGTYHPTVGKVRAELEQSGDVKSCPFRKDRRGHLHPAHKGHRRKRRDAKRGAMMSKGVGRLDL
jgi:predicted ATP-dependent protease